MIRYEHLPDHIVVSLVWYQKLKYQINLFIFSKKNFQMSKFNVVVSFIPGVGRAYQGTEVPR